MEAMTYLYTPYIWPYIATISMNLFMILYVFKNRRNNGAIAFCVTLLFSSLWCIGTTMEISAVGLETKLFWVKVGYLAYAFGPLSWTIMVLQITDRRSWTSWQRIVILSILPVMTVSIVWTNEWHGLIWQHVSMHTDGTMAQERGWWFLVHAAYSDGLNFVSVFLTIRFWQSKAPLYGKQFRCLAFSMIFVMFVNAIYVLKIGPNIDPTPIAWGISSLFITWSLFRNKLFDLVPIARNRVLESMADGIVVLDGKNRIVDMNLSAQNAFQCETTSNIGCDALKFFAKWPDLQGLIVTEKTYVELEFVRNQECRYYEAACSPLKNERDTVLGKLLTIRDITDKKLAELELLQKQQEIAVKEERERMARDLHDNLGQIMGFVNLQAQAIRQYLNQDNLPKVDGCLARLTEVAQEAHNTVRETILSMRGENSVIKPRDFFREVERQADLLMQGFGIRTEVDYTGAEGVAPVNPEACGQVLNILKESMNNIIKHSRASAMKVVFEKKGDVLWISVIDNGCGFDYNKAAVFGRRNHYGLLFMQERAAELGGDIHIHSEPGQGTSVIIMIPKLPVKAVG